MNKVDENSCCSRRIKKTVLVNAVDAFADLFLFGVFMYAGFEGFAV